VKLEPSEKYVIIQKEDTCVLDITKTVTEDAEIYICKATNSVGEATTSATLRVQGL
jgi:hypothetical protein